MTDEKTGCPHEHLQFETLDQTGGVVCNDCNTVLAYCWMDNHVPESLWNRLAAQDPQAKPCEQSRDDACGICGETIEKTTEPA